MAEETRILTRRLHERPDDSWTLEENNIVIAESAELSSYFETDFQQLWSRGDIAATGLHDTGTAQGHGTEVKLTVFAEHAHHVAVHFTGADGRTGEDAFTFGDLTAQRDMLMKVCPVR